MKFTIVLILMVVKVGVEGVLVIQNKQIKTTALVQQENGSDSEKKASPTIFLEMPITFPADLVGSYGDYKCLLIPHEKFASKNVTVKPKSGDWVVQLHSCTWNGEELKDKLLINYNLYHFETNEKLPKGWYEFAKVSPPGKTPFKVCERESTNYKAGNRNQYVGLVIVEPSLDTKISLRLKYKVVTQISAKESETKFYTTVFSGTEYYIKTEDPATPLIRYRLLRDKGFPLEQARNEKLVLISLAFNGKMYAGHIKMCMHFFRLYDGDKPEGLKEFGTVTQNSISGDQETFMMYTPEDEQNVSALALKYQQYVGFESNGVPIA